MKSNNFLHLAVAISAAVTMGCDYSDKGRSSGEFDTQSYQQPGGMMYFFENGMPDTISTSDNSKISLASQYRKDGSHSLAWEYQPESTLTFNQPIGYKPFVANDTDQSQSTFTGWIYNAQPQQQKLKYAFGTDGKEQVWFEINLDFKGWRQLIIPFKDMQGTPIEGMNFLQVQAPASLEAGTFYFDQLMLSIPVDPRWPTRDEVVPFINLAADTAPNRHWLALYRYNQFLQDTSRTYSEQQPDYSAVAAINAKLDSFILNGNGLARPDMSALRETFASYELGSHGDVITGKPLDNSNRLKIFLDKGVNKGLLDQQGFDTVFGVAKLRAYGEFMLELAQAMRSSVSDAEKQELAQMYVNLTRYALDQGYATGSSLGTSHHMGYTLRALFQAHFFARDLLQENGLLVDVSEMMAWFSGAGRIYRPESEMTNFNVDVMNTQLRGMLYSILMQPDESKQAAWLDQFSFWLSRSITTSHGLGGGFKADGSVFHHAQHYPAYAKGALKGLTPVVEVLSRTPYAISQPAHQVLKYAVQMTGVSSNDQLTLMSVTGRHPDGKQEIDLSPYQHMALAGSPDGKQRIDSDMAEAYLRLMPKTDKFGRFLQQKGFKASAAPNGNWAMNFANLSIQRRDGWVAAVRGFSRYLVGNESYANANRYGRYINYGQLEIMGPEGSQRAFSHDGWNWNRWPGTTAVQLPFEQLRAKLRNVDAFSGLEEMLMSEQAYAGALSDGENGMFAMKLQGHSKYDASFAANKSVFFFDNRIIALGTDIKTQDNRYPTQTTLFQHAIRSAVDKAVLNGMVLVNGEEVTVTDNHPMNVLLDPDNNAYFVPGDAVLQLSAGEQSSVHQKNSEPTLGQFVTAVIDHGKAPQAGRYEYAVLVDSNPQQADRFADQLATEHLRPYLVEKNDEQAHIVWDRDSNTRAYAFFDATSLTEDALIRGVDLPAMVMAQQDNTQLSLAVVNPDLNLYEGNDLSQYDESGAQKEVSIYSRKWKDNPSESVVTTLTLEGKWQASQKLPGGTSLKVQRNGSTLLKVTTVRAESVNIELTRV